MFLEDRFTRGFIAGIIGALAMDTTNFISYYVLHFTTLRYLDIAFIGLRTRLPANLSESIFGQMAHLVFAGAMGVVFAYWVTKVSSRNYLLKGWFFSVTVWFATFTVSTILKLPHISTAPTRTMISAAFNTSVYGLVLAQTLYWLDNRIKRS